MAIDLNQLLPTFIEESLENVEEMEELLLNLDLTDLREEDINQIFRSVHTIKGNSTIFKFSAINDLAKNLENLLENVRKKMITVEKQHLNALLKSSDCFRNMLLEIKKSGKTEGECSKELVISLIELNKNINNNSKGETQTEKIEEKWKNQGWLINYTPLSDALKRGNHPENLFRAFKALGNLEINCDHAQCPALSEIIPTECYLSWELRLRGNILKSDLQEILAWSTEESEVKLSLIGPNILEKPSEERINVGAGVTSIRVSTEKIDSLMNTAEELVITESILKQITKESGSKIFRKFSDNLENLEQHSRRLQEIILRMRMVPIAFAINRFPKMVLDLAKQEGKEIEFKFSGEKTEIDKTMVEKITDPLMHLIRNAIDHGIEKPEERKKNNKNRAGSVELVSYQSGNNIIIDIKDDGRGLDAKKIRESGIKKGLVAKEKILTEEECFQLIFQPGFSTADKVTDISGRGVGLDVVMKNIRELGGQVEVLSIKNAGTTFRLRLPLNIAIMDCQLIKVGAGFYAIPLSTIIEMCELDSSQITLCDDNSECYTFREETFKLIHLDGFFSLRGSRQEESRKKFLIKIKADEMVFSFSCDEILFQQQIVVKNIEENYSKVPGILGAAVLGDGELALILDIKEIVKLTADYIAIGSKIVEPFSVSTKNSGFEGVLSKESAAKNAEYLCFLVENKEYAFNMKDVKEVCVWQKYARLPFSPSFLLGIINRRGKIVPVVDPRALFGLIFQEYNINNVIIILQIKHKDNKVYVGLIVDSVTETKTIHQDDIELDTSALEEKMKSRAQGIANVKEKAITLFDAENFLSFPEQKWSFL